MPEQFTSSEKFGWSLNQKDPRAIQLFMPLWEFFYHHYFRVQTSGWNFIPKQGNVLLVGSHNGGLASPDMFMMIYDWFRYMGLERPVYGLLHPAVWKATPVLAGIAAQWGAVVAHPKMAIAALQQKASVLVYPGGAQDVFRPHALRNKICLGENQGFVKLALEYNVPIVPLISHGAHDTLIVLTDIYEHMQQLHQWGLPWFLGIDPEVFPIYLGLPWGVGFGPLPNIPLPVQLHTRVCPPIVFDRYGREAARDRVYVNECYNKVRSEMQQELNNLVLTVERT